MLKSLKSKLSQLSVINLPVELIRGKYLAHFGLHNPGNAGDTLLFLAVRKLFDNVNGSEHWKLEQLWDEITDSTISRLNKRSKGIIIGGGGLLLRDTNKNQKSGWQWSCSIDQLRQIQVPIVVFAIGYNRFRNQEDFDPIFQEHIQETVSRSLFFGLRNHGSIRALTPYLEDSLISKLQFQPCPTTILSYLYPEKVSKLLEQGKQELTLNMSFDRRQLRFGLDEDKILTSIARAMKWANQKGWKINLTIHCPGDDYIEPWLLKEQVVFRKIQLGGLPPQTVLDFYSKMPLTIGMRGHSQMIPFGMGNAIISLISHDKLGFFLEDINHPEWGIDIHSKNMEDELIEKIQFIDTHRLLVKEQIEESKAMLWNQTLVNLKLINIGLKN